MNKMMPIETTSWKCPDCGELCRSEREADIRLFKHVKERCINHDFQKGFDLGSINFTYGLHWELSEKQKRITKDNCFTIPYLQCCDHPAYQIRYIDANGKIIVGGCGSWTGHYQSAVRMDNLSDPRPKEELYVDKRSR